MKSCLVPPNLKNAGVNALANTRNFGELEKENAEQMCQQVGEGRHKENKKTTSYTNQYEACSYRLRKLVIFYE